MMGSHTHTSLSTPHDTSTSTMVDRSMQQLEELNRERETEYRTLASRYNADDTKDTVHDAERNRGTYVLSLALFYGTVHMCFHITQTHGFLRIFVIGIIDGGTWEHRKRAKEMLETAEKNNLQSIAGRGSHFMGDFLPVSAYVCEAYILNLYIKILFV